MPTKYLLVSLPQGIFDSSSKNGALSELSAKISPDNGSTQAFAIPDFKIGTLDALVQQADDLTKLEAACETVVAKVADSLRTILDGDDDKISQQKMVNDKPTDHYINSFVWNKVRYRADRPLGELVDILQKELVTSDNDVKTKFNQYNSVKTNFTTLQRKQTGNLSTKSLTPVVDPALLVKDSEYLETHLIVVPSNAKKDFQKGYETLAPMVVPRSAVVVAQDDEFVLFAVTTFKKTSTEFLQKCREQKWTPRQYKYVEGGKEEEQRELDRVAREEKKVWGEALRMGCSSLRPPLDYVSALVKTTPKLSSKVRAALDSNYSYLGGNAFGRDKRGRVTKDDAALSSEMAAAGVGGADGTEYTAYVYYEFELP
ncbi:vacuolar ATP synthase subunit C [Verticillium alfalfae VaMs.102]|uniref:V-type proton ATPase subunit C n=1 Tax=Verticillium alfalfae (strain VaMs.102 / ATCC MYA-4576 / FGSC 10136) TaxID=526221 RepID=C9SLR0_VERA1|nr:vacuolar ATP synthase subunit C [Verticillium alfalfae VaMs.102]EEY19725.1 vacuolar ATP synthase subunit C [Verticillium alfalfae VaMs.102]